MQNFKEVKEAIIKRKAGFEAKSSKKLSEQLHRLLTDDKLKIQTYKNFKKLCEIESKKSESILSDILK